MKRLFGILNLILCFELIIGPNNPGMKIFSVEIAKAETCPAGLVFDSTLNRCITSDQQATLINATASCNGDQECYKRLAEEELKKGEQEGKIEEAVKNKSGLFNNGIKAAGVALPLIIGAKSLMGSTKCLSTSKIAMAAGGVALFVGDMLANKKHKSCLKKIRDDWEKKKAATTEKTSSGITKVSMSGDQSEAFEMLAKSEECMQSSAKMKAGFYGGAAAAFAGSSFLAIKEHIDLNKKKADWLAAQADYATKRAALATACPLPATCGPATTQAQAAHAEATRTEGIYKEFNQRITCEKKGDSEVQDMPAEETAAAAPPAPAVEQPIPQSIPRNPGPIEGMEGAPDPMRYDGDNLNGFQRKFSREFLHSMNLIRESKDAASFVLFYEQLSSDAFDTYSSPSIERYESLVAEYEGFNEDPSLVSSLRSIGKTIVNELVPFQSAHATVGSVLSFLDRPKPRAVISGVLAGWSAIMMIHANKQARTAKNRAEFLRGLKNSFNDATGAISCTEEERSLPANANCYCYTEGGQRNSARGNSQICQQLWTGKTLGTPNNFAANDFSTQRVCIASNGSADEKCACKANRSCLSAIPGTSGSLGIGAISAATSGFQPLNDITNGNIAAGNVNGAAALNSAANLLNAKNKLAQQLKDKNLAADNKKIAQAVEGSLIASAAGQPAPFSGSSSLPLNMTPSQAASALEKELGEADRTFERVGGSPALAQPGDTTPGDESGFSLGTQEPAAPTEETQLAEVMGQDLNYGQNDITKSNSNLFDILSNRYQRSGMRRLFDEQGKSAPEPAAKSDIAQ